MAIDWRAGYTATWRAYEVLTDTWADGEEVGRLASVSVERSRDGDAPLLESGELAIDVPVGSGWDERYVRVAMVAEQGGERERVDVCTLLCSTARGEADYGRDFLELTGRSVLYPASTKRVRVGTYAPAGTDGAQFAASMLRDAIAAPVLVEGSFTLGSHVVFDVGVSVLKAVWTLLRAGGFTIRVSGDGSVAVAPEPTEPVLHLSQANARLLHPGVPHELDWSDVPNRYYAIEGSESAEAVNDDPGSPTSTVRRGYEHDEVDTSPVRVGGETLAAYCARRLEERSVAYDTRSYAREFWPDVVPGDMVSGSLASVGLEGDLRVTRQSLSCGEGIVVDEEARREVHAWLRR